MSEELHSQGGGAMEFQDKGKSFGEKMMDE